MVKTIPFNNIQVASPGFGAMGLSFGFGNDLSLEQAEPVLLKAIELGCTFWDTAVSQKRSALYVGGLMSETARLCIEPGSTRSCSEISSGSITSVIRFLVCYKNTFAREPTLNSVVSVVASKCGFDCMGGTGGVTNSASHIKGYIEGTIERLGFAPDLYYLHRIDPGRLNTPHVPYSIY